MSTPQKPHMGKKRKRERGGGGDERVARHATALQISTHQRTCTYTHTHSYTNLRLYLKRHHKWEQCCHKAHKYKYVYIMQYNKRQKQQTEEKRERIQPRELCAQGYVQSQSSASGSRVRHRGGAIQKSDRQAKSAVISW